MLHEFSVDHDPLHPHPSAVSGFSAQFGLRSWSASCWIAPATWISHGLASGKKIHTSTPETPGFGRWVSTIPWRDGAIHHFCRSSFVQKTEAGRNVEIYRYSYKYTDLHISIFIYLFIDLFIYLYHICLFILALMAFWYSGTKIRSSTLRFATYRGSSSMMPSCNIPRKRPKKPRVSCASKQLGRGG